jgi:hypothetical protein
MRSRAALSAFLVAMGSVALAQTGNLPTESLMRMEMHGGTVSDSSVVQKPVYDLHQFPSDNVGATLL